jgi:hypothetical protein
VAHRRRSSYRARRRRRADAISIPTTESPSQAADPVDPATLHPPLLPPFVGPVDPPVAAPPVPVPVPVPVPPVPLPPVPGPLDPAAPPVPVAPPLPPPPLGASLGFVKLQDALLVQTAPSDAHLQSEFVVHQPSIPFTCVPAGLQVCVGSV